MFIRKKSLEVKLLLQLSWFTIISSNHLIFVIIKSTPAKNQSFIEIHAREHSTAIFGLTISQSGTVEHVRIWWVVEMGSHFKSGSGTLPSVDGAGES
jgi:hypothetical protein